MIQVEVFLFFFIDNLIVCDFWDSKENQTETNPKPFFYNNRYHPRNRRQNQPPLIDPDTAATVLSILPLDGIGRILGQIMSTGLKEMLNPDVGKKIINVLENQAPLLLTSFFTNLYSTLGAPVRPSSNINLASPSGSINMDGVQRLSNSSSEILNAIRRPTVK